MSLRFAAAAVLLLATAASAQDSVPVQRIVRDAMVIDRVAEASKKDLPVDLLKRIVNEDIDLLRGKRTDGSFQYATYERLEASRINRSVSVQPRKGDTLESFEIRGPWVYRLLIASPTRRLLVTKNRQIYIDRVEIDFIPEIGSTSTHQTVKVDAWIAPGEVHPVDFPAVAKQATARVFARADDEKGYGNVVLTLVQAKIIDNADSPYADSVASAKAMLRAIDSGEIPSIRAMATRIQETLGAPAVALVTPVPSPQAASPQPPASTMTVTADNPDLYRELQEIEDLLTGSEGERRQGLDRLHQLIRKYRPQQ